jgi:hypothetical protein
MNSFQHRVTLSRELELERTITVREAAEINSLSEDTFKRTFGHLIRKISPRRSGVKLRDALNPKAA